MLDISVMGNICVTQSMYILYIIARNMMICIWITFRLFTLDFLDRFDLKHLLSYINLKFIVLFLLHSTLSFFLVGKLCVCLSIHAYMVATPLSIISHATGVINQRNQKYIVYFSFTGHQYNTNKNPFAN